RTKNLPMNITFISVYIPPKKKDLPESGVRFDLLELTSFIKGMKNVIIGGDFNSFNNAWGCNYNDVRGKLLIEELESLCLLNDGTPTRIPEGNCKANPLDLTWSSSNIYEKLDWSVKSE